MRLVECYILRMLRKATDDQRFECQMTCSMMKTNDTYDWWLKCVNSGYLPDDGPSGSAGWSWMTWVMALIMGNGIDYGTIHGTELMTSDHGIWHWSWNWKWPCQIMSMILAKGAKHDHDHDSDLSDMGHGTERFMIWSWYWSVPWAWHWYWYVHDTEIVPVYEPDIDFELKSTYDCDIEPIHQWLILHISCYFDRMTNWPWGDEGWVVELLWASKTNWCFPRNNLQILT